MTSASGFGRDEQMRTTTNALRSSLLRSRHKVRHMKRCKMPKSRRIALLVAAATSLAPHNNSVLAETQPCRPMEYEHNPYTICEVDL